MSDFIGSVISLISKSDIRYVGTLVEINPTESTVSLENVKSHGTEGRKSDPAEEVLGSSQIYEFIVFRGSDVKDLRVEETPAAPKENVPPPMPNDPAIVGARSHPGRAPGGPNPPGPPGATGFQNPNMFPPYPPQGWGRPGPQGPHGPPGPPGPGGYGVGYPPPGWFPGQGGFQQNAPPPWNYPFPGGPPGGPPGPPGMQHQQQGPGANPNNGGQPRQDGKATAIGPGGEPARGPAPVEMPSEPQVLSQQPINQAQAAAPTPPVESKPSAEEVQVAAALLENQKPGGPPAESKQIPTGPKGFSKNPNALPAGLDNSAEAARNAAVQGAIARLGQIGQAPVVPPVQMNGMDNLAKRVSEMSMNAARSGVQTHRGRGRGRGGIPFGKVEVPKSDFDFAEANAKFNKDDVVKEKIAGTTVIDATEGAAPEADKTGEAQAYNKTRSFFDDISSDSKDRQRREPHNRGAETTKNVETFGQASVDGGYRRGRGGRGRGRGRGRARGFGRGGQSVRGGAQPAAQ